MLYTTRQKRVLLYAETIKDIFQIKPVTFESSYNGRKFLKFSSFILHYSFISDLP